MMTIPDPLLLELPAAIETPRLRMRPPQPGDGQALFEAVSESLPALRRFLGALPWVAAEPTCENFEAWCRTAQANFLARKDFPFFMFDAAAGHYIGTCRLHRPEWSVPKLEIGYWCRSSRIGQGLVSEGVKALMAYADRHFGVTRLEAITDEENLASRRVAERSGFVLEGVMRAERRASDGSLRNTCMYARLREESKAH